MFGRNDYPDSPDKIFVIDLTGEDDDDISVEEVDDSRPNLVSNEVIYLDDEDDENKDSSSEISTLSDPEQTSRFFIKCTLSLNHVIYFYFLKFL